MAIRRMTFPSSTRVTGQLINVVDIEAGDHAQKIRTARKTPTFAHWRARIQAMSARQRSAGTLMLTPSPSESLTDGCTLIRNALLSAGFGPRSLRRPQNFD